MTGWLTDQLPRAMRTQPLVAAFSGAGEEIADSIRHQVGSLDAQLDPNTASPHMLAFVAGWLGFALDPHDDPELLRRVLKRLGAVMRTRGTRESLTELLVLLSGGAVRVADPGSVTGPGQPVGPPVTVVRVELDQAGPLGLERLRQIVLRELPVGVTVELTTKETTP